MVRKVSAVLSATIPVLVVAALASRAEAQGDNGFLRGTGKTDVALTYSMDTYREFWVGQHKVEDPKVGRITRQSLNLWGAYGIDPRTDVVVSASYVEASSDGNPLLPGPSNDTEKQLQDATIGLKYRLNEWQIGPGGLSLSFAPAVKIPMTHYENDALTAIGDGQIDYRGRIIAHYRFDNGAFASVETGFDYRTERPANEMPLNVTIGATFFDHVTIAPFYTWTNSFHGIDIGQGDFPATEEDVERVGVSVFLRLDQTFGLTGGWKTTIDGKNTGDLDGWWAGIVLSF